jgi:hypothetical protein
MVFIKGINDSLLLLPPHILLLVADGLQYMRPRNMNQENNPTFLQLGSSPSQWHIHKLHWMNHKRNSKHNFVLGYSLRQQWQPVELGIDADEKRSGHLSGSWLRDLGYPMNNDKSRKEYRLRK